MRSDRLAPLAATLALAASAAGCSVVRLSVGESGIDVSDVAAGAPRTRIEERVGRPVREWTNGAGTDFRTYQYDAGRVGSFGDASAAAFFDLISGGIWEMLFLVKPGDFLGPWRITRRVVVAYGPDGTALGTFDEYAALPADGRVPPGSSPWTPVPRSVGTAGPP